MTVRPVRRPAKEGRRFRVRPAYILLLIVMGLFAYKFIERTQEVRSLTAQQTALQRQNDRIARENWRIQQAIRYYHTPQYVEEQARALLGYTKPGDVAVQVDPHYQRVVERAAPPQPQPTAPPAWRQWWSAFSQ